MFLHILTTFEITPHVFPPITISHQVLPQLQALTRLEVAATTACLPTELGHTLSCCPGLRHLDISGWPVRDGAARHPDPGMVC